MMECHFSEIRVTSDNVLRVTTQDRRRPKIRLQVWFKPSTGGDMRPGSVIVLPVHKIDDLVAALQATRGAE